MLYANYVRNKMSHLYKTIIAEVEGVPCVLEYSKGHYMKNYRGYGNSVQDGMPSPDNPVEIQSVGDLVTDEASEYYGKYDIPITVAGKNLLKNDSEYIKQINGITFSVNNDRSITVNGTATANAYFDINSLTKYKSGDYYLSGCPEGGSTSTYLLTAINSNSNYTLYKEDSGSGVKISLSSDDTLKFQIHVFNGATVSNLIFKPQLELGSSATEYEPYRGNITSHIYIDEPLRKIGDYADYIDFKKHKVVRKIKEVTYNGTEDWKYNDTNNIIYLSINNLASSVYCYSTHFLSEALKDTVSPYFRPVTGILRLYQNSNIIYSSADEFKAFLENQNTAGTPLIVDYILSTTVEENISLPDLQTFKNTTIMSVDTTVLPSNIKVTYVRT